MAAITAPKPQDILCKQHKSRKVNIRLSNRYIFLITTCFVSLTNGVYNVCRIKIGAGVPLPLASSRGDVLPTQAQAQVETRHDNQRLLIVVPFTAQDVPALQGNLKHWRKTGAACTSSMAAAADLWFYYGKHEDDVLDAFQDLRESDDYRILYRCFRRVQLVCAKLTKGQDDYPAGINLMFFHLLVDGNLPTSPYHSMFWMEPDVFPIKPYWVDKLVNESSSDDRFWIKGSIYMGDMFDSAVGNDWQWIGHINGNALYRLNSPEFKYFLSIVMDLEPPGAVWKPFDVSIWKVLHDLPYFWHIHQRIAKRFLYGDFINHWAFSLSQSDVQLSKTNPGAYFVHGKETSAGTRRYREKRKAMGEPNFVERGLVDTSRRNVSVLIRAQASDVEYADVTVMSVMNHLPGALEIVLAVPSSDVHMFATRFSHAVAKLRVVGERALAQDIGADHTSSMQEAYTKAMADTYCFGEYILQLPFDCVLTRDIYHKDLFFAGKPVLAFGQYEDVPIASSLWQKGTLNALGLHRIVHVNSSPRVFPRDAYSRMRARISRVHAQSFISFMSTQKGLHLCVQQIPGDCPRPRVPAHNGFSLSAVAGAFMQEFMHDEAAWIPQDKQQYHRHTFVPIISEFACQGNSWLARQIGRTVDDVNALRIAVTSGSCDAARSVRLHWKKQIVRSIK